MTIAASSARASRMAPTVRPKATTQAKPSMFMITSSMRLVIELGFSNGWAELALKKPPPLVPSCLIASWSAMGPRAMACLAPFDGGRVDMAEQGLGHAQGGEDQGDDDGAGQQDVEGDPHQVGPEVAERCAPVRGEGPGQGRGDGDPGGGGGEVLHRQPGHLRQVAGRALAGIELPVGVGEEADGGVERQVRREAGEPARIERQDVLQPQDGVEEQKRRSAEGHQRDGVGQPPLPRVRIDPGGAVEHALHRLQPGDASRPHPFHVEAQRKAQGDREPKRDRDLGPTLNIHCDEIRLRTCRAAAGPRACRPTRRWRRPRRGWRRSWGLEPPQQGGVADRTQSQDQS